MAQREDWMLFPGEKAIAALAPSNKRKLPPPRAAGLTQGRPSAGPARGPPRGPAPQAVGDGGASWGRMQARNQDEIRRQGGGTLAPVARTAK